MTHAVDFKETATRSLCKALTYRVTGTIATGLIAYFVTGNWKAALAIGFIEPFVKLAMYYIHERVWQRVAFGKVQPD